MANKQEIIIFTGPDGSGKTTIAKKLSPIIKVPYFKNTVEKEYFKHQADINLFVNALNYEGRFLASFLLQTAYSIILDRSYPCEYAYSRVFNRENNDAAIFMLDDIFNDLGASIIYCFKDEYSNYDDKLVDLSKIEDIKKYYEEFLSKTVCKYLKLNTADEDLPAQINEIMGFLYP